MLGADVAREFFLHELLAPQARSTSGAKVSKVSQGVCERNKSRFTYNNLFIVVGYVMVGALIITEVWNS